MAYIHVYPAIIPCSEKSNMKSLSIVLILIATRLIALGQAAFSFNQGGASQDTYHAIIPYENVNGKIIINVSIKGKTHRFILDTGAPTSISARLSDEIHPTPIKQIPIFDINGISDSLSVVQLDQIGIGGINFNEIPTLVIRAREIFECFNVDGLIGSNLLRNSVIQLDNSRKVLVITNDIRNVEVNPNQSSDLILDKQSSPIISILLKNKKKATEQLLLDLGANGLYDLCLDHFNLFSKNNILKIQHKAHGSNSFGLFGHARDTTQYRVTIPEIEINGTSFINVSAETSLDDNSRIGSKLLEYGMTTIDYKNKMFYFDPFETDKIEAYESNFPISFIPKNKGLYVGFVWESSIKNISAGDQVMEIDGVPYDSISICDLMTSALPIKDKEIIRLKTLNSQGQMVENVIERK